MKRTDPCKIELRDERGASQVIQARSVRASRAKREARVYDNAVGVSQVRVLPAREQQQVQR